MAQVGTISHLKSQVVCIYNNDICTRSTCSYDIVLLTLYRKSWDLWREDHGEQVSGVPDNLLRRSYVLFCSSCLFIVYTLREQISTAGLILYSGAALLPHPSMVCS